MEPTEQQATTLYDTVIIGGGPAGLAAAIYAGRASMKTLLVEQGMPGGQISVTDTIDNYPGLPSISGPELGQVMQSQAEGFGVEAAYGTVEGVEQLDNGNFSVSTYSDRYLTRTVVYAGGGVPREIGFKGEQAYKGRGVSYCATCDGMFYRNKQVFVIGGGNSACEEALFLTNFASKVTMVVRRDRFRAPKGVADKVLAHDKIDVRFSTSVVSVEGGALLSSITFRDNVTGEEHTETYDEGSFGVFVFAGYAPVVEPVASLVDVGRAGGILTDETMATRTPGLYCAGDVREKGLRQVVTAVADGAIAATSAYKYLESLEM